MEKRLEKIEKYTDLGIEIKELWNMQRVDIVPIVIGCTGVVDNSFVRYLGKIPAVINVFELQKIVLLNTCYIVRRFCPRINLAGNRVSVWLNCHDRNLHTTTLVQSKVFAIPLSCTYYQTDTLIKQSKCSGSLPRHFLSPLIKAYRNTLTYYTNLMEQCNCYPSINTISCMIG